MSEILYSEVSYLSGACSPCMSCCYKKVTKKSGDAVPLDINWKEVPGSKIGPHDILQSVEYAVVGSNNCPIDDCVIGVTPTSKRGATHGRRSWDGPFSRARLWGGNDCSNYKVYALATYESCGEKYCLTTCIDVAIENC